MLFTQYFFFQFPAPWFALSHSHVWICDLWAFSGCLWNSPPWNTRTSPAEILTYPSNSSASAEAIIGSDTVTGVQTHGSKKKYLFDPFSRLPVTCTLRKTVLCSNAAKFWFTTCIPNNNLDLINNILINIVWLLILNIYFKQFSAFIYWMKKTKIFYKK